MGEMEGQYNPEVICQLIKLVQENPCIYDVGHPDYRVKGSKAKIWTEIANILKVPRQKCKAKWKALRDQFARETKRYRDRGMKQEPKWRYYSVLKFLSLNISKEFAEKKVFGTSVAADELKQENRSSLKDTFSKFTCDDEDVHDNDNDINIVENSHQQHQQKHEIVTHSFEIHDSSNQNTVVIQDDVIDERSPNIVAENDNNNLEEADPIEITNHQREEYHHQQNVKTRPMYTLINGGVNGVINSSIGNNGSYDENLHERKMEENISKIQTENEIDSFFKSIAIKLKNANLPNVDLVDVQIEILQVISNKLHHNKMQHQQPHQTFIQHQIPTLHPLPPPPLTQPSSSSGTVYHYKQ